MPSVIDQLGRPVTCITSPKRIISLVPSQTELLYYLGLDQEIAGITRFCVHPAVKVKAKLKIGGTKNLDLGLIQSLNPDLIIANKEENERVQVEELTAGYPTYISDPSNFATALQMINDIGTLTGRERQALQLSKAVQKEFAQIQLPATNMRVAYFIWRKPYMVAGSGTFINNMLQYCGFINVFDLPRYPQIDITTLGEALPELILLSSEPYLFGQKHIDEFKKLLPGIPIKLVDGEMFSWYGSHLLKAPEYFSSLINSINGFDA